MRSRIFWNVACVITLSILSAITVSANYDEAPHARRSDTAVFVPRFTDAQRREELANRRMEIGEAMEQDSLLILFSAVEKVYTRDVNYRFRQENNLYYLTALKQKNIILVILKNGNEVKELLFVPKRNPRFETWNGKMYSNADAKILSGIETIIDADEFEGFVASLREIKVYASEKSKFSTKGMIEKILLKAQNLRDSDGSKVKQYLLHTNPESKSREYGNETAFVEGWAKEDGHSAKKGFTFKNISADFAKLRLVKSPYEIKLMQHAIDITGEAIARSMSLVGDSHWEYEIQSDVEYAFRRKNADFWGFPSIIAAGANSTTLHYEESQGPIKKGELLLTDIGAEYDHYTADVTRTFPVNGKFSDEQAAIYQIVFDAQEAAAKELKPGAKISDASRAARAIIEQGLVKLGLITKVGASIPGSEREVPDGNGGVRRVGFPQFALWYMHGWGHWVGMNVHDVGSYNTPLAEGMITSNEPGIYIRADALDYLADNPETKAFIEKIRPAYEKYKNIGVRIEDDMLITADGVRWMSGDIPRSIEDIEGFMARAKRPR